MSKFVWVADTEALKKLTTHLHTQNIIAVDTESDSLYSYFEKVCLVQISTTSTDYIIDPLAVDIALLSPIFAADSIEKVFHAAEYDIMSLRRDYGFSFSNIFDTMFAARILGWSKFGLSSILKTYFQVELNKHFQQYNWGKRPLTRSALLYARLDTHYLIPLRDIQLEQLQKQKRLEEARAAFKRITYARAAVKPFEPADFWRIRGAKSLSPQQQQMLHALFVFRDECARQANTPSFKIMHDSTMVRFVLAQPKSMTELKKIRGLNRSFLKRHGRTILTLLNTPYSDSPPQPEPKSSNKRLNGTDIIRYEHLRGWRNNLAQERGVEPDVILSNGILKAIAKANPKTYNQLKAENILGKWQFKTYAEEIIEELRNCPC